MVNNGRRIAGKEHQQLVVEATVTPPHYYYFYGANDPAFETTIELARRSITEAMRFLQTNEPPDTFLGRQRHDFIPPPKYDVTE
jgi:hypothetical protein